MPGRKAACRGHVWSGDPVILDTDAVTQWDFRGLLERMAQTVYLDEKIRDTVQCCEVTELILLISQVVTRRHNAPPPSATSLLVAKAVAYLQANYTDPHLTVAQLAKYTYTSREHLSRVFKEYTLESIHGYLTNLRMQHCRNELADGTGRTGRLHRQRFCKLQQLFKEFPRTVRHHPRRVPRPTKAEPQNAIKKTTHCGLHAISGR